MAAAIPVEMLPSLVQALRKGLSNAFLLLLVTTALTALFVVVYHLQGLPWSEAVYTAACFALPCVAFGALVWKLQTHPWLNASGAAGAAVHVVASIAFAAAWTAVFALAVHYIRPGAVDAFLRGPAVWQFTWGLLIYGALAVLSRVRRRLEAERLAAASAELAALRSQLNPHFLFNTLHSLTQLAREDPAATVEALERFGWLMRHVLQSSRQPRHETALDDELRFVREYLALERLRLADRLRVVEAFDDNCLDCAVPPLLLQPLVENAVRHGIAPLRRGGTLRLTGKAADGVLHLGVEDDGAGCAPPDLAASTGLGLTAVRHQLAALGRARTSFAVETSPGAGFRVRLSLPARDVGARWR